MPSDTSEKTKTGGCLCGNVRYEITGEPLMSGICHCRECQRATGTGQNPVAGYLKEQVTITGTISEYSSTGGSGKEISRVFCPNCGSRLFGKPQYMPNMIMVTAGTLDDPEGFSPQVHIFTGECPSWHKLDENLPAFEGAPPSRD